MKQYVLGIELGSTRIKAVLLDETHAVSYTHLTLPTILRV